MESFEFKEPIKGYTVQFTLLPLDKLHVSENQRKPSKEHVQRLMQSMERVGFVTAPVCVKDKTGDSYTIIDGQHRFLAAKELGLQMIPCMIIPAEYAKKMMELNVEKTMNFREKSYVAYNVYQTLLKANPKMKENDVLVMDSIESAHFVTAGIAYSTNQRLYGSAFNSMLRRIDFFLDVTLEEGLEIRKKRADLLNKADALLKQAVQAIREKLAIADPFLFQEVVSACNPIGRKRKIELDFDTVMNQFIENAQRLIDHPEKFKQQSTTTTYTEGEE
jgi:ParB family chromosome partitioning protein